MKLLTPLALISVSIAMYFLYISPMAEEVLGYKIKKDQYSNVLSQAQEIIQKRDDLAASFSSLSQEDRDKLGKLIPETFDPITLANDINSISLQNRLKITDYRVMTNEARVNVDPSEVSPFKVNIVTISIEGQFADFVSFLQGLELNLRLFDVTNLTVNAAPESTDPKAKIVPMKFSLTINTYSLK